MARLDQHVARHLGASRRHVEVMFRRGRVCDASGARVEADRRVELPYEVRIDGVVARLVAHAHVLQHKPTGVVTAMRDALHPTAHALLAGAPLFAELRPVGRLDLDTSGLLLWTTDGDVVQHLTHPRRATPRTYHAALSRPFAAVPADFALRDGHVPAIVELVAIDASECHPSLTRAPEATCFARITIASGVYHEVKRIFAALGSEVVGLARVSFGAHELPRDLPPGAFVALAEPPACGTLKS